MNRLLVVVAVLACLLGLASGGLFGSKKHQQQQQQQSAKHADLDGLGHFLVKKLKDNNNPRDNFAVMESSLDRMDAPIRKAAELMLALRDAQPCNDQAMRTLAQATRTGLVQSLSGEQAQQQRISRVIKSYVKKLFEACEPHIREQIEAKASSADNELQWFMSIVIPSYKKDSSEDDDGDDESIVKDLEPVMGNYEYIVSDDFNLSYKRDFGGTQEINEEQLARFLSDLAARDHVKSDYFASPEDLMLRVGHRDNFEAAFKKYLVEPCRQFEAHFEPLFDGAKAAAALAGLVEFVKEQSVQFRQLAYTHKACEAVIILDDNDDRQNLLGFKKEHMLRSIVDWPQGYEHYYRYYNY